MRVSTASMTAGVAAILLSACSSAPQAGIGELPPTGASGSHAGLINLADREKAATILRKLYISNLNNNVAVLKYGTWKMLGTITNGIASPYSDWVDTNGNLYVSSASNSPHVSGYDPSGNLLFTYSAGMGVPLGVTTDKAGNLYEADNVYKKVNEYAQGSNVVMASCSLPSGDHANYVAVNKRGTVFVSFSSDYGSQGGGIIAYPLGLNAYSCAGGVLPIRLGAAQGMAFDKLGNLVVCDSPEVDIIAPPYKSITGTLGSGWLDPQSITIDRAGTQAYVADSFEDVRVLTYPGGTNVATLGSANGLMGPTSAVDSKNYVP